MDYKPHADYALAKLHVQIEAATLAAKKDLKLPHDKDTLAAARSVRNDEAPLFVHKIAITGQTSHEMYDEHPGLAYYQTTNTHTYKAPPYCGLAQARDLADRMVEKMREATRGQEESEGDFSPSTVQLQDHAGRTLQVFDQDATTRQKAWLAPVTPEKAVELVAQAGEMRRDASEEMRGDNFETSRRLHDRAMEFIAQATASKLHSRAIP